MTDVLTPNDPRPAAIAWVANSLAEILREPPATVRDRAESFVAIAEHCDMPIEYVVQWIFATAPEKQWSALEFRGYAERFVAEAESLRHAT